MLLYDFRSKKYKNDSFEFFSVVNKMYAYNERGNSFFTTSFEVTNI